MNDITPNPKVSVVLPVYNGARFIRIALRSVLAQDFKEFEILVVDDGSTDGTVEIVREMARNDGRIRYFKNENNLGIQKTLNRGLAEAKGEYIARIDDDDEWIDPVKLTRQVSFLNAFPAYCLVGMGTVVVNECNQEQFRFQSPLSDKRIRKAILIKNCFTHSGVLFRKESVLRLGGYSEDVSVRHVEDYDLWLRLGRVGKLANLPFYATKFMLRGDAISSRNKTEQFRKDIGLVKKYWNFYPHSFLSVVSGRSRLFLYVLFRFIPSRAVKNFLLKIYKSSS